MKRPSASDTRPRGRTDGNAPRGAAGSQQPDQGHSARSWKRPKAPGGGRWKCSRPWDTAARMAASTAMLGRQLPGILDCGLWPDLAGASGAADRRRW